MLSLPVALLTLSLTAGAQELKRYLYMSTPDGAQDPGFGNGIHVFDLDDGYRHVRFVDVPNFTELRGFEGNLKTASAYYSWHGGVGRFDLLTERVVWERDSLWERDNTDGFDRCSMPLDASKLYCPMGWWIYDEDAGMITIDPENGNFLERAEFGSGPHNSLVSANDRYVYMAGRTWFNQIDRTDNDKVAVRITDPGMGDDGVYPFTVTSDNRWAYICHYGHVGFDVLDLTEGKMVATVGVHREDPDFNRRTHGVALSHDESEIWISDVEGRYLWVFDNTVFPPVVVDSVNVSFGGHGWVHFSSDGKHVWSHTEDIIDRKTRKIVHTLRGPEGNPIRGSKYFEAHFLGDSLVWVGKQFGLGYRNATPFSPEPVRIRSAERRTRFPAASALEVWSLAGKRILRFPGPVRNILDVAKGLPGIENGVFLVKTVAPDGVRIRKIASMR